LDPDTKIPDATNDDCAARATSEPPGEWNDNECEKCGADGGDEEHPEEDLVDDDGEKAPLVQQLCGDVVAVVARDDAT